MDTYLNFDLEITTRDGSYLARVIASPNGETRNAFDFPFDQQTLEKYISDFSDTRSFILNEDVSENQVTSSTNADQAAKQIQQFGETLFSAIFQNGVAETFRQSQVTAKTENSGLRVRLRFPENPELINIPWEFLFDKRSNTFLTLSGATSIVRYMELSMAVKPMQIVPPLKVLVVISDPIDYPSLNVHKERDKLLKALDPLIKKSRLQLEIIEHATLRKITHSIGKNDFHIIHFIGHGDYNEQRGEGVIVIETDDSYGLQVSSKRVATMFDSRGTTRLIVLNACEGGITSEENIFSGVAQSVVKKGVPAVLAMQYAITDKSAIVFSETFYEALSLGNPVDTSLSRARLAIYNLPNEIEFATAALYMRAKSGRLFGKDKAKFKLPGDKEVIEKRPKRITFAIFIVTSIAVLSSLLLAVGLYNIALRFL